METKNEYPPNWNDILITFPDIEEHKPVFAYGNTIYNPFNRTVPSDIIFHEAIHMRQQGASPEIWWDSYLKSESFRLQMEIEAYGEQYAFVRRHIRNGRLNRVALSSMAQALCSSAYGNLLSFGEAEATIKRYAKGIEEDGNRDRQHKDTSDLVQGLL